MNSTLDQLEHDLSASLSGLNANQTQFHLTDDTTRWSIQQIVQHLLLTYNSTATALESRLAKGRPTFSRPRPQHRAIQFVVLTLGRMPGGRQAPPEVTPSLETTPLSGEQLTHEVIKALLRLDDIFTQAEETFGSIPCQSHFVLGPLSASQWRRFHLTHGRHHIRQILAIRRAHRL
ncbi:DUF1569 domain-containing protein [Edaphobacter flagellatus]|uniref:DUF1569 domain-containing protein n=1 Tax=Edaphobacter flagellatus TaxID=1933044 RepID=UPI0021B1992F|nr:DUF1569 domain-containing protein [Edaphobacter flagellatus]